MAKPERQAQQQRCHNQSGDQSAQQPERRFWQQTLRPSPTGHGQAQQQQAQQIGQPLGPKNRQALPRAQRLVREHQAPDRLADIAGRGREGIARQIQAQTLKQPEMASMLGHPETPAQAAQAIVQQAQAGGLHAGRPTQLRQRSARAVAPDQQRRRIRRGHQPQHDEQLPNRQTKPRRAVLGRGALAGQNRLLKKISSQSAPAASSQPSRSRSRATSSPRPQCTW